MAIVKENNIVKLGSLDSGYKSAQQYYGKLKERFLTEIIKRSTVMTKEEIEAQKELMANNIIQGSSQENTKKTRDEALNEILTNFAENAMLGRKGRAIEAAVEQAKNEIKSNQSTIATDIKKEEEKIITKTKQILYKAGITKEKLRNLMIQSIKQASISGNNKNNISERYEALIDRCYQFFHYVIKTKIMGGSTFSVYGVPQITLGGYIAEDLEYQNLLQVFNNTNIKLHPGGAKKLTVNNKKVETEFDNIMTSLESLDDLQKEYTSMYTGLDTLTKKVFDEYIKEINYFGQQVKTFSLGKSYPPKEGYTIGERGLHLSSTKKNQISIYDNIAYMSKYKNILATFGPATVLFSSGNGRQWMSDFIKDFREQQYYLMLKPDFNNTESLVLTNTVILDRPFKKNGELVKKYACYRTVKRR